MKFAREVPLLALSHPLLLNAILAFAAVHLSKTKGISLKSTAERYHEMCVKLLIALKQDEIDNEDGVALAAVCLLRSYEILGEAFDPNRHLRGGYALAVANSRSLQQPCLTRAGFFNYLREDITFSLINRCPLKIDLNHLAIPIKARNDEDQLNIATLYLANTINLVFGANDSGGFQAGLREEFWTWRSSLPAQFTPYFKTPLDQESGALPTIRVLRECHVAVLQYSLVTTSVVQSRFPESTSAHELNDKAVEICGLTFSAESPAVVVNSFGPIAFSCRYLRDKRLQLDLVRRLQASRRDTGWPVRRIIDDLEHCWQYRHNSMGR